MRGKRKKTTADPYGLMSNKYIRDNLCKDCIFNFPDPESNDDPDEYECKTKENYTHTKPKAWKNYTCANFKPKTI